jgi:hypothetical protein
VTCAVFQNFRVRPDDDTRSSWQVFVAMLKDNARTFDRDDRFLLPLFWARALDGADAAHSSNSLIDFSGVLIDRLPCLINVESALKFLGVRHRHSQWSRQANDLLAVAGDRLSRGLLVRAADVALVSLILSFWSASQLCRQRAGTFFLVLAAKALHLRNTRLRTSPGAEWRYCVSLLRCVAAALTVSLPPAPDAYTDSDDSGVYRSVRAVVLGLRGLVFGDLDASVSIIAALAMPNRPGLWSCLQREFAVFCSSPHSHVETGRPTQFTWCAHVARAVVFACGVRELGVLSLETREIDSWLEAVFLHCREKASWISFAACTASIAMIVRHRANPDSIDSKFLLFWRDVAHTMWSVHLISDRERVCFNAACAAATCYGRSQHATDWMAVVRALERLRTAVENKPEAVLEYHDILSASLLPGAQQLQQQLAEPRSGLIAFLLMPIRGKLDPVYVKQFPRACVSRLSDD